MAFLQGLSTEESEDRSPWTNLPVHPDALPAPEDASGQGLSPKWLQLQVRRARIAGVLVLVIALVGGLYFHDGRYGLLLPVAAGVAWGGPYYLGRLFASRSWVLRQRDITYRSGWLWHRVTTLPFNRVQHCGIAQGLIEKWYGLATLEIYTAGKSSSDMRIPGLDPALAEQLKTYILRRSNRGSEEE